MDAAKSMFFADLEKDQLFTCSDPDFFYGIVFRKTGEREAIVEEIGFSYTSHGKTFPFGLHEEVILLSSNM